MEGNEGERRKLRFEASVESPNVELLVQKFVENKIKLVEGHNDKGIKEKIQTSSPCSPSSPSLPSKPSSPFGRNQIKQFVR